MNGRRGRSLLVAALQTALLLAVAGRFLLDRATLPRGWARTAPVDPALPVRGRYVSLRLEAPAPGLEPRPYGAVGLAVRNGRVEARVPPAEAPPEAARAAEILARPEGPVAVLREPLAFFLTERVRDPSLRPAGEELWVEVTVPPEGPPRPIRLGVRKGGGRIEALSLR